MLIVFADFYSNNSDPLGALGRKKYMASLTKQREQLLKADELLHARLWQLQNMDKQYSSLLTVQRDEAGLARANASIETTEQAFQKAIDSIERMGRQYDEQAGTNDFQNITAFFKTILDNRRFLAYTRSTLNSNDRGASSYITILKLQEEIQTKDKLLAQATNKNAEKEKSDLQNAIAERDKQIQTLRNEVEKQQVEKQTYAEQLQKLQVSLTEKDKLLTAAANKLPTDQKALHTLQTQITDKNNQIRTLEAQVQKDQSEKQGYLQTVKKLQADLTEKNKAIAASSNKVSADQKTLVALQTQITDKTNQVKNLEAQLRKEQSEKQSYLQTTQKLQADLNEKNKIIVASANKKTPTDQKALLSLQAQITDKNNQIKNLEGQVRKEQSEKLSYSEAMKKLQTELGEKNRIIAAANTKLPADQKAVVTLQKEIAQKNEQIRTLQAAIQKEQAEKKSYLQTAQNLQSDLAEKNRQLAAANNKKPITDQKTLSSLQNSVAEKDKRIRALEDQLKQSQARTTDGSTSDDAVKKLQQKNNNLTVAYNNTQAQINLLIRKYNALKSENDLLRNNQR